MDVILVEESTLNKIPRMLEVLVSSSLKEATENDNSEVMSSDLLVVVLYELMIEAGFTPLNVSPMDFNEDTKAEKNQYFNVQKIRSYRNLPRDWKVENSPTYYMSFVLIPFVEDYACRFIAVRCGELLIVNVIVGMDVNENVIKDRSICLRVADYVINPRATEHSHKFGNLKELSMKFKDKLTSPMRCAILTNKGVLNPSLLGVPDELKIKILKELSVKEVTNVSETCRAMLYLTNDQSLWKYFLERDFKYFVNDDPWATDKDWKQLYSKRYQRMLKRLKINERFKRVFGQFDLSGTPAVGDGVTSGNKLLQ